MDRLQNYLTDSQNLLHRYIKAQIRAEARAAIKAGADLGLSKMLTSKIITSKGIRRECKLRLLHCGAPITNQSTSKCTSKKQLTYTEAGDLFVWHPAQQSAPIALYSLCSYLPCRVRSLGDEAGWHTRSELQTLHMLLMTSSFLWGFEWVQSSDYRQPLSVHEQYPVIPVKGNT